MMATNCHYVKQQIAMSAQKACGAADALAVKGKCTVSKSVR